MKTDRGRGVQRDGERAGGMERDRRGSKGKFSGVEGDQRQMGAPGFGDRVGGVESDWRWRGEGSGSGSRGRTPWVARI